MCLGIQEPLLSKHPTSRVPCSQSCTCSGLGTQWHGGPRVSEPPARDGELSHPSALPSLGSSPHGPLTSSRPAHSCPAQPLTRLSNRLATMEANLRSPASSEMRKMYSGAETWLDRWVRPGDRQGRAFRGCPSGAGPRLGRPGAGKEKRPGILGRDRAHQTAGWHGLHSRAAQVSCVPGAAGSGPDGQLGGRLQNWRPLR